MTPATAPLLDLDVLDVSPLTTAGALLRQAERRRAAPFVHYFDPAAGTWRMIDRAGFRDRVLRVAAGLVKSGVELGDHVILISENRLEWMVCDLAIQACGAATVAVHPSLTAEAVASVIENAQPRLAIASTAELAGTLGGTRFVTMNEDVAGWMGAEDLEPPTDRLRALTPDMAATIAYTSGTTGQPKGAVITHRSIVAMLEASARTLPIAEDDVVLGALPLSHILERFAGLYFAALREGAQVYVGRGLDRLVDDLAEVRPTCMNGVPRIFEKMMQHVQAAVAERPWPQRALFRWAIAAGARNPLADRLVLRKVRERVAGGRLRLFVSGAAPLAESVERFFWSLGLPIFQGWGMTELTCVATVNTPAAHRFGTVGRPLPGVEVRVAEDGEVLLRSPGVMSAYLGQPDATAEAFDEGWFRTGDIGVVDQDGFLVITDRKKELLKTSGGKFVAPLPIETALQQDALVQTAVVMGDGRRYATALLVPDWAAVERDLRVSGAPERLVELPAVRARFQATVDRVNAHLASFETIKRFRLLPEPLGPDELTVTYKLRRKVIAERHRALVDAMYAAPDMPG